MTLARFSAVPTGSVERVGYAEYVADMQSASALEHPAVKDSLRLASELARRGSLLLEVSQFPRDPQTQMQAMLVCSVLEGLYGITALLPSFGQAHAHGSYARKLCMT